MAGAASADRRGVPRPAARRADSHRSRAWQLPLMIHELSRILRHHADREARCFGISSAQWAVISCLEGVEGCNQSALAKELRLRPISLTRLLDRLSACGLIERRSDDDDRRAKRLFLTVPARSMLGRLDKAGEDLMRQALRGLGANNLEHMTEQLALIRGNLRRAAGAGQNAHAIGSGAAARPARVSGVSGQRPSPCDW